MMQRMYSLRGGGVACSCQNQVELPIYQAYNPDVFELFSKLNHNVQIIEQKAALAANQQESSEIMIAIQWFFFQEQNIYKLNKNVESVKKSYDLIMDGIKRLLCICQIYIKTDSMICLYILQITTSLSKVIFSFHLMNNLRFMDSIVQKQFLEICHKLRLQIEIEKNDLIQNQIELFLLLTQISIEIAPNNSNEQQEILSGCLQGIVKSICNMSPDVKLFQSLFKGVQLLYQEYKKNKKRKQYELYYQLDMFQWEVIIHFQNNQGKSLQQMIFQIGAMYETTVKGSINWRDHYLWIQMLGKILTYNPLITKKRLGQVLNSLNLREKSLNQVWENFSAKGLLIQLNFSNDSSVILLNQLQNKKTLQLDRLILEYYFKGWECFNLLKEILMNEQQEDIPFTLGAQLKSRLDLGDEDNYFDQNILATDTIQKFLNLTISDELLSLIKQSIERLEEVIQIWKSFQSEILFNLKISLNSCQIETKKIIRNFKEFFQNIQQIQKIFWLNLNKNDYQTDECIQSGFINYEQQAYFLRLLKQTLEQFIEQTKLQVFEQQNLYDMHNERTDFIDNQILTKQIKLIQKELVNFYLNEREFQFLNDILSKFLANTTLEANQKIQEANKIIKYVDQFQKQISKLEIIQFQKQDVALCFKNILQRLYCYYKEQNEEIYGNILNLLQWLIDIFIRYQEIESACSIEELTQIKQKFYDPQFFHFIEETRFNFIKLNLHLISFRESFLQLLGCAQISQLQQMIEVSNFNQFLLEAIIKFPVRMNGFAIKIKVLSTEIKSLRFTDKDLKNQLIEVKGIIQFQLFKLQLEEQEIDVERENLKQIKKEFGQLFMQESSTYQLSDFINKILQKVLIERSLQNINDKHLNKEMLKIEQEIYENLLNELRKIKVFQLTSEVKQLIQQTEIIVQTFRDCVNKHIAISRIIICEALKTLLNNFEEYNNTLKNNNENSNLQLCNINPHIVNLEHLIQLLKIQENRIAKYKQILEKIFYEIQQLFNSVGLIENSQIEIQSKMLQDVSSQFQYLAESLQKLECTNIDLQSMDIIDLEGIISNLQKELDENEINSSQEVEINNKEEKRQTKTEMKLTNAFEIISEIKTIIKNKLTSIKWQHDEVQFEQEFIIIQINNLYFDGKLETTGILEIEENSHQELGFFENYKQLYKDFKNNEEWRIKQGIVFTIIQISSNCFSNKIFQFCQKALILLWTKEKDQRIRNLLKNTTLISMQMQILQKDWKTQNNRIEDEMKFMLRKIDDLQEQISHEVNLKKREKQLVELDETTQQLDEYIQNITEMGQQLRLITDFLNHIRKGLTKLEGKINDMKNQLNSIGSDIKFLRGKSVTQLFEIRKWKVLKDAASKNVKSIYIPLQTQKKIVNETQEPLSNLINFTRYDDREGEVNEFILDSNRKKQSVMLIHGLAGSGKSTTAKKIEEFIWKLHEENILFNNLVLIPIYISLPSLKNPVFQVVEEALHQVEYGFDELQLKECKEMLEKKEFRFLFIFDGYDEMNLENIQKNLYRTNKLYLNWSNPLVIFTTRSEIFSGSNYIEWFAPEDKTKLKEVQLVKFDKEQMNQYLQKFTLLSIKVLIYETYEWSNQIQSQQSKDEKKFEMVWEKLESSILQQNLQKFKSDLLLNEKQVENILQYLKNDKFIAIKNPEILRNLEINLLKLWSVEKYENILKMVNIDKLVETPYLMEIVVQVLPAMLAKAIEIVNLKYNFLKNFSRLLSEALKSAFLINMYNEQRRSLILQNKYIEKEQEGMFELQNLDKIDYSQVALQIWQHLEQNQIPVRFEFDQEFKELSLKLLQIFEHEDLISLILQGKVINKFQIEKKVIIELMCDALKEQNLTSFDFYDEFIKQYYQKQIEKQRNLGKSINVDRFLHDMQQYSIKLAKQMSLQQLTQIQYKQQGLLYKDKNEDQEWLNEFFNDDGLEGQYKKDVRSCTLVQQKGLNFQFVHKSIQEFLIAYDLHNLFVKFQDIDLSILSSIKMILSKNDKIQDVSVYLSNYDINKNFDFFRQEYSSLYEKQCKLNYLQQNINKLIHLLKDIKEHDFNKINYSTEIFLETRKYLIKKISKDIYIIECLKFLVHLTANDKGFIQSGSNSLNLLVKMQVDLSQQIFKNIRIKNTSIAGGNFVKCNFNGSEFENVNINNVNLNGAFLLNCKWNNIRINELHSMKGHSSSILSISFSPDGKSLASGSADRKVCLWDSKTGEKKFELDKHDDCVFSVCYSPDGTKLASGSCDNTINLWDLKTMKLKFKLYGHSQKINSLSFSSDGTTLASGGDDKTIIFWDSNSGEQKFQLNQHSDCVMSVCFSQDGSTFASGGKDNLIYLWNAKSGEQKFQLKGHSGNVYSICFSPNGTTLASGSADTSVGLWNAITGKFNSQLKEHTAEVVSVSFSPDGTLLASGDNHYNIFIWDVISREKKSQFTKDGCSLNQICFSPDGNILASGSSDQTIHIWDLKTGEIKSQHNGDLGRVYQICFSPDGKTLFSGSQESVRFWEVNTGTQKSEFKNQGSYDYKLCCSPDGTTVAANSGHSIYLLDSKTAEKRFKLIGHGNTIHSLCFSPDSTRLASGSGDMTIRFWDVKTGEQMQRLNLRSTCVSSLCYSPDGITLASGNYDMSIRLWDVNTGEQKSLLNGHGDHIFSVCFSPNGKILASGGRDKHILLQDIQTGEKKLLKGHTNDVLSISFSPNGNLLASGSYDSSVRLWDVETGELKLQLNAHKSIVYSVCFSPDGTKLASASHDKSIRIWDMCGDNHIQPDETSQLQGHDINAIIKLKNANPITLVLINKDQEFQASGALVFQEQITNHSGMNLRLMLKQKGSIIIDDKFK